MNAEAIIAAADGIEHEMGGEADVSIQEWIEARGIPDAEFRKVCASEVARVIEGAGAALFKLAPASLPEILEILVQAGFMHGFFLGLEVGAARQTT